jgi:hypothetical protein
VDVVSNKEDRYVARVTLYYLAGVPEEAQAEAVEQPRPAAPGGKLSYKVNGERLTGQGTSVAMSRKYEPTVWRASIPPQQPGLLRYWVVAEDSAGENTLGAVQRLQVVNFAQSKGVLRFTNWTLTLGTLLGLGLMRGGRRFRLPLRAGLWLVGSQGLIRQGGFPAVDEGAQRQLRRKEGIMLAVGGLCVLLILGLAGATPQFQNLFSLLKGSQP